MSTWVIDREDGSKEVDTAKDDLTDEQLEGYYEMGDLDAGERIRGKMTPGTKAEFDLKKQAQNPSRYVWQPGDVQITPPSSRFVWQPSDVQVTPAAERRACGGMHEVPYTGPNRTTPPKTAVSKRQPDRQGPQGPRTELVPP